MKKSPLLDKLRRGTTEDIKREIDLSFEIADRIFAILAKKNLSQRDLANMLGKSEAEISKWMRGTHNFTTRTIAKIESVLGEPVIEVTGKPKETEFVFIHIPQSDNFVISKTDCIDKGSFPMKMQYKTKYPDLAKVKSFEYLN